MKNLYTIIIALLTLGVCNAQSAHSYDLTWSAFAGSGATLTGDVYEFPSGAQAWAGFANDNSAIYPMDFTTSGVKITFTASASSNAVIRFKVENAPHPDVSPNKDLGTVTVTGGAAAQTYEVVNNVSDSHPYKSLLMYIDTPDVAVTMSNFKIYSDDVLSIAKVDDFEFSLYPNPVRDVVNISAGESIQRVRVYDLTGRIVKQANPNTADFSLDVADLSKGVYFVKLNAGDREASTKLIK
jgi:hypothetical protein